MTPTGPFDSRLYRWSALHLIDGRWYTRRIVDGSTNTRWRWWRPDHIARLCLHLVWARRYW